ncbi:hypothetical protein CKO15_02980 [Halorhodospira abdelmalekii]|uniref:hypothetical protein n=1 Tax=Halorhodospira abdelmalekii TaxID=421629 RepID=UPI001904FB54|nr:hypothetical protein [Halorhodospira abdelmalekii]MBK1734261.1 hypothetical protein [Halorhodospira abdelmalekii]
MADGKEQGNLPRRGVVRASGGPLRDVKIELGVVILLVVSVWLITLGIDAAPWWELIAVLGASSLGAAWVMWRARRRARQLLGVTKWNER